MSKVPSTCTVIFLKWFAALKGCVPKSGGIILAYKVIWLSTATEADAGR